VEVTWGTTPGTGILKAQEKPKNQASCEGGFTEIPVVVIAKPTITFNQTGTPLAYRDSICKTVAEIGSGITYGFPVTVETSSSQVLINYTMVFTPEGGVTSTSTSATDVPVSGGTISSIIMPAHGTYVITIDKVTDRVSRKSSVNGVVLAGNTFTYKVMSPVQTGPIYRIPNDYE
jgi:hypothetical protein